MGITVITLKQSQPLCLQNFLSMAIPMYTDVYHPRCEPWCWNIYLQNWAIFRLHVGNYFFSTMEPMLRIWGIASNKKAKNVATSELPDVQNPQKRRGFPKIWWESFVHRISHEINHPAGALCPFWTHPEVSSVCCPWNHGGNRRSNSTFCPCHENHGNLRLMAIHLETPWWNHGMPGAVHSHGGYALILSLLIFSRNFNEFYMESPILKNTIVRNGWWGYSYFKIAPYVRKSTWTVFSNILKPIGLRYPLAIWHS